MTSRTEQIESGIREIVIEALQANDWVIQPQHVAKCLHSNDVTILEALFVRSDVQLSSAQQRELIRKSSHQIIRYGLKTKHLTCTSDEIDRFVDEFPNEQLLWEAISARADLGFTKKTIRHFTNISQRCDVDRLAWCQQLIWGHAAEFDEEDRELFLTHSNYLLRATCFSTEEFVIDATQWARGINDISPIVARSALRRSGFTLTNKLIERILGTGDALAIAEMLGREDMPLDESDFKAFSKHENLNVRAAISRRRDIPPLLGARLLSECKESEIRANLISNEFVPVSEEQIDEFTKSEGMSIRTAIANRKGWVPTLEQRTRGLNDDFNSVRKIYEERNGEWLAKEQSKALLGKTANSAVQKNRKGI